jgi:hypothetical protein
LRVLAGMRREIRDSFSVILWRFLACFIVRLKVGNVWNTENCCWVFSLSSEYEWIWRATKVQSGVDGRSKQAFLQWILTEQARAFPRNIVWTRFEIWQHRPWNPRLRVTDTTRSVDRDLIFLQCCSLLTLWVSNLSLDYL